MPITGKESTLSSSLKSAITSKITAATGQPMEKDPYLSAVCEAIAEVLIPFLTSNIQVESGASVTVNPHPPGGAATGIVSSTTIIT